MKANRSIPSAQIMPVLSYPDVRAAVTWLCTVFGFVERLRIGENHRAQLQFGEGAVIIADLRADRSVPRAGQSSHAVLVRVEDARAHCERARQRGAQILSEPQDYPYGERQYSAVDLAGHHWTFSETLADVPPESWGGTPGKGSCIGTAQ